MVIPPLARGLHLQMLTPLDWLLALGVGVGATAWRAVIDHLWPVSTATPPPRPAVPSAPRAVPPGVPLAGGAR
jgi:hypothetical protein